MKLSGRTVRELARRRGESLTALLDRAGVSRTAFYSLARRETVLPKTILALSRTLGVSPAELLEPGSTSADPMASLAPEHRERLEEARRIVRNTPGASFQNVWHTLCLLELDPMERLNRSLIRGRATALHS